MKATGMIEDEGRPADLGGLENSPTRGEKAGRTNFCEMAQLTRTPIILSGADHSGEAIFFANDAFLRFSGYSLDEILGREPKFLTLDKAAPQAASRFSSSLAVGQHPLAPVVCRGKDGTPLPAIVSIVAFSGHVGKITNLYAFHDREQIPFKDSAAASEKHFRLLVESVTDYAIYMLDPHGYIVSWNNGAERIKGYSEDEVVGRHVSLFYTEEEKQAGGPQTALAAADRDGRFETENWRVRKDGSKFLAHVLIQALRDDAGELVGFAKVTRDVTERQRIREAEHASEAKTQFLASMSHEIRTPLNGIIGYTERLIEGPLSSEQRRYAERIQTSGTALLTIINDILDLSQIEAGRIEIEERPFSFESLLDNVISIISGAAEEKKLPIRLSMDPAFPKILIGDEDRLRQILLNLLNNAVKFTQQGFIALTIRCEDISEGSARLFIRVQDTGIGIPRDKRHRLFRRFSQIDRSIRREYGGTGLGLAISKRLLDLMGGEIGVESVEGEGSVFWFRVTLPLAAPGITAHSTEEPPPVISSAVRILLAEDLEINQDLARTILEGAGHQVDVVWDGDEAVSAVMNGSYDLVLMDIQMPVKDGVAATREIRALGVEIPIIAMTANVLPQQIRAYRHVGMNDHIGKPMKRNDLLKKVNEWAPGEKSAGVVGSTVEVETRPIFDLAAFNALSDLMGSNRTAEWLKQLESQLTVLMEANPGTSSRGELRRQAHALVSQAGNLGFFEFSDSCMEFEAACDGEHDLSMPLKKMRASAARVLAMLPKIANRVE